jgi:hypothetical protein
VKLLAEANAGKAPARTACGKAKSATTTRESCECESCERDKRDKGVLRRFAEGAGGADAVPPVVHEVLRGPAQSLESGARRDFEHRFGRDFSGVRVHTGARAAESARAVKAQAYTVGNDMVFGAGRYAPQSTEGRRLLAHELTHVAQNSNTGAGVASDLEIGATNSAEEREADAAADVMVHGGARNSTAAVNPHGHQSALRRAPGTGPGWSQTTGINAGKTTVGTINRIPIDGLPVGHQTAKTASGKAIVLIPDTFDPDKSTDILLHFHGHNAGYREAAGKVRDEQQDNIEAQLQASKRTQMLAILPQGDYNSSFGELKGEKVFDTDAFVDAVLGTLLSIGAVKKRPSISQVMISGHSGAGELINEKLLGGAAGSALPARFGTLKEVALIDAINGPKEFEGVQRFLKQKLADELKSLLAISKDSDRETFLKTSFRFRAYYSHAPATGTYYSQWHVGPIPKGAKVKDPTPIAQVLSDFFKSSATLLASKVLKLFQDNYQVIDAGATVVHDEMVGDSNHLKDALSVLPKREPGAATASAMAPPSIHQALRGPAKLLDEGDRSWAENRFGRGFGSVRIHDDMQAGHSAEAVQAQAYTVGRDIVFAPGRYVPGSPAGRGLLAHELSHVIQQGALARGTQALPDALPMGMPGDRWEREAEHSERATLSEGAGMRVQRAPKTVDAAMCEANKNPNPAALGDCNYKEPENCPTYEGWIGTFMLLKTFEAVDTPGTQQRKPPFTPIGGGPADVDFRDPSKPAQPAPPPTRPLKAGERFIDHPTDDWVKNCLPANLRATAYQLPADCADVAMILRHVWLAAHKRTEKFGKWTLGSGAGRAEEKAVFDMITNEGTGGVAGMVAPYSDTGGKPLRSFKALEFLLHPGDILVWWHYENGFDKPRTGGHTHTISGVQREPSGKLTGLTLLQGNEPLFSEQKQDIHDFLKKEKPKAAQPTDKELGEAPGRRIERTTAKTSGVALTDLADMQVKEGKGTIPVWKWGKETLLVAAGPPRTTTRPATQPVKGEKGPAPRRLTDWVPAFSKATTDTFMSVLDGMLYELRATVEGGKAVDEADVRAVGSAAGAHIWKQGKAANDLGNSSHFQRLQSVLDVIWGFATSRDMATSRKLDSDYDKVTTELLKHLRWLRQAFEFAARGAADIDFTKGTRKGAAVNVLVTGFDPFEPSGSLRPPGAGEWNPSGAAVLALDSQRLPVTDSKGGKATAAVEGIVLPVSFDRFSEGMVEQMIGPHAQELDALLTVSLDGRRGPGDSVRLEHYAVGVHGIGNRMEAVPAASGGVVGPAVIQSQAPLDAIADVTARPKTRSAPEIPRPEIGESFVFDFGTQKQAQSAQSALGGDLGGAVGTEMEVHPPTQLMIKQAATVKSVTSTLSRVGGGAQVRFSFKQQSFQATLIDGPGGNFLSNEVSYRAQRLLQGAASPKDPWSFHVHTQSGGAIPQDVSTVDARKKQKDAMDAAKSLRSTLIDTLKRVITATAKLILDRRAKTP